MCGILHCFHPDGVDRAQLDKCLARCKSRGPDETQSTTAANDTLYFGFNRLAIHDLTATGSQPMTKHGCTLICNGEIYNCADLVRRGGYDMMGGSDCEVVLDLYDDVVRRQGKSLVEFAEMLDGEFSFVLYDAYRNSTVIARDPFGVRPLFANMVDDHAHHGLLVASTLACIDDLTSRVQQFPPGHVAHVYNDTVHVRMYRYATMTPPPGKRITDPDQALRTIRDTLTRAVEKRLDSEREVCALLSGGLDSSLVAALAARCLASRGKRLRTFSIGLPGSPDVACARQVASHIRSDHTEVVLTEAEFLDAIPEVIRAIESYDVTTVRASVGNYLLCKHISEQTSCKVVLNGDYSDEVTGGYMYFSNAPHPAAFDKECKRLLHDICYFDSLRSDRCISANGLEGRTPFADKEFVRAYMSIDPSIRCSEPGKKKRLLRAAFDDTTDLLPAMILWRPKEAFSDGVSPVTRSWNHVIHDYVMDRVSYREFKERVLHYKDHVTPSTLEAYLYRKLFAGVFRNDRVIPYQWMPRWVSANDPSARTIAGYLKHSPEGSA